MATQKMIVPEEHRSLIHPRINKTAINKDSIEGMTKETDKMVKGTFVNIETPGQTGAVSGLFYKGMEYFHKVFLDGETYVVPLSIARFINERCQVEEHSYLQDEKGNPIKSGKKKPRYKFMIESMA